RGGPPPGGRPGPARTGVVRRPPGGARQGRPGRGRRPAPDRPGRGGGPPAPRRRPGPGRPHPLLPARLPAHRPLRTAAHDDRPLRRQLPGDRPRRRAHRRRPGPRGTAARGAPRRRRPGPRRRGRRAVRRPRNRDAAAAGRRARRGTGRGGRPVNPARPLRTVLCGTGFGRFYAEALARMPDRFELTGILARGSGFARDYAERAGVPLYTDVRRLPADTDAACVVVGSAVSGGPGGELALALLERGVHVIQEHPVHPDELAAALRTARGAGAVYHLNPFYRHTEPIRRFLAAARSLRERGPLLFADAASALQVLHPLLDVLALALGGLRPRALGPPLTADPAV